MMGLKNENDTCLQIHRLFKRLQQRNKFVDVEPRSSLTLAETHLLKQCLAEPERTLAEYQKLFFFSQNQIARLIHKLEQRGFLTKKSDPRDARAVLIALTKKGSRAVKLSDEVTTDCYLSFSRFLNKQEKSELVRLFKAIADGYDHPQSRLRRGETEYSLHQRRMTRCFRLLGKNVFGSHFNSTQWQILSTLYESPIALAPTVLANRIGISKGTATAVIKGLIRAGLVTADTNKLDLRSLNISISQAGVDSITLVEKNAAAELKYALRKYSNKQCKEWLSILRKYVVDSDETLSVSTLAISTLMFSSLSERTEARSKLITELVRQNLTAYCPATIASDHNLIIGFKFQREIVALFDFVNDGKSSILTCGFIDQRYSPQDRNQIVKSLKSYLEELRPKAKLICRFEPLRKYFKD